MKIKNIVLSILTLFILNACDSKNDIDEELIASSKKEVSSNFESKTFTLTTSDNKKLELNTTLTGINFKDFKNKIVLVDVFATWCPPCIKGIPSMNELQEEYKDELIIISVLFERDKSKKEIKEFIKKHNINYIVTLGEENFNLAKELGNITKVPEYYLYDKNGVYVKKFVGENSKDIFKAYIENIK